MRKIREILRLKLVHNLARNAIARSVKASGSTVTDYLARAERAGLGDWAAIEAMGDDELEVRLGFATAERLEGHGIGPDAAKELPDFAWVHTERKKPGVTLQLIWSEYIAGKPDGYKYTQFCEHYRRWEKKLGLVMRQTHRAGEKIFVDYSGDGFFITDRATGKKTKTELFVGVLGASSYTFAEATMTQQLPDWLMSHARMYEFFGGASELTVPDNLKSGVKRACFYDPEINPSYRDLAIHYKTSIMPARSRKPRDKAKAEAAVLLAQRWILAVLRNRTFYSLGEINDAIRECLITLNTRVMRGYGKSRKELFETLDKPLLRALPAASFEFLAWKKVRVNIDYHIEFERHFYSVPYQLVHKHVEIRASQTVVEVIYRNRRIASHLRSFAKGAHTTCPEHMPSSHRAYAEWTPSRMIKWAEEYGGSVAAVIKKILAAKPHPEMGFRSALGVIRLGREYGKERLERACAKALAMNSPSYRTLKSMLASGMDGVTLPGSASKARQDDRQTQLFTTGAHLRGKGYYH